MRRKTNRLNKENYNKHNIYFLTVGCFNKAKYFESGDLVNSCIDQLKQLVNRFQSKLWVYCFMPDHVHLLLETEQCGAFIKLFKQITGHSFRQQTGKFLWQKSYYDHILRDEESLNGTMAYILNNPVRAKLVNNYLAYPYSGSFEVDIKQFVED